MKPVRAVTFEDWLKGQMRDPEFRRGYHEGLQAVRLAYRLHELREARGWSQAELARRMGTSQQAISRLEQGDHDGVTLRTLSRMAEALDAELVIQIRERSGRKRKTG